MGTENDDKAVALCELDDFELPIAAGGEVLEAGDHIFYCLPGFQHHAIVLDASSESILIAEFTNAALLNTPIINSASHASAAVTTGVTGGFRILRDDKPSEWHKVKYSANPVEQTTWRSGTCSGTTPDSANIVLNRVLFLHECHHLIPEYNVLASNCECVAVWCMTGRYSSLQSGWALDVTKVAAAAVGSLVSPILGVAAGGAAVWHSMHIGGKQQETTTLLNKEFEWYSMGKRPLRRKWVELQK